MFDNIPHEMRLFKQFVVWRYEDLDSKKPTKVPYSATTGRHANVNVPETWCSFDQAVHSVTTSHWYNGIGFVLTDNDPFAFIDLDDSNGDQTIIERQTKIFQQFDSFAEKSPSGKGLHIIVKGAVPAGRKRSMVEIYSSGRYMTMTGDVYRNAPINDHNQLLNVLWTEMGAGDKATVVYAGLAEAKHTDEEILNSATNAANGEKFTNLYSGNWESYYQSQSEADFALVDIIAFYSENRAQTCRMFRASQLGQRDKAKRNDYMKWMLDRCFDRLLPPIDISGLQNQLEKAIEVNKQKDEEQAASLNERVNIETVQQPIPATLKPSNDIYSVPPGLVGEIAKYIYEQAPRPVPEIALAGAVGMMSGIVGRAYNVSGTGLNQYIMLIAKSGVGKEAMPSGIDKIFAEVTKAVPCASDFRGPAEIASPQAISNYMANGPKSFASVMDEFGITLNAMGSVNAAPSLEGLRRFLLSIYTKSGLGNLVLPSIWADKAKNTKSILSPAFSILGYSSPEVYYEGLHEGLILQGLLPRFTGIEYKGELPDFNENFLNAVPSFDLVKRVSEVCANALMLNSQNKVINVAFTNDAQLMFNEFRNQFDDRQRITDKDTVKRMWSRVHVKAMKLAAVVAVGCNPYDPTITATIATWATSIVAADTENLLIRVNSGEIGVDNDETRQIAKVGEVIRKLVVSPWEEVQSYMDGLSNLHANKIIPYSYIQRNLVSVAVFRKDRMGATGALKRALQTLMERGDIEEIPRATLKKNYGTGCKAYMISNMKAFDL